MKKNTAAMVLGILFGLGIIGLTYFNLILSIAVAFATKGGDFFEYSIYVYPAIGVIAIVGSALARKNVIVTRIMLLIPVLIHIALIVYTSMLGILFANIIIFALYAIVALFGLIALILSFAAKNRDNYQSPPPSFTPPSQSAQM